MASIHWAALGAAALLAGACATAEAQPRFGGWRGGGYRGFHGPRVGGPVIRPGFGGWRGGAYAGRPGWGGRWAGRPGWGYGYRPYRGGYWGGAYPGVVLGGLALGGIAASNWGDPFWGGGYGYGYDPYVAASVYTPVPVAASVGGQCQTPVRLCTLMRPSYVGIGCSCRVPGGRARGSVVP